MAARRVVVIEGEDAAAEAMRATLPVLAKLGLDIEWLHPEVGIPAREHSGSLFPDDARRAIDDSDTTLFGATSGPSAPASPSDETDSSISARRKLTLTAVPWGRQESLSQKAPSGPRLTIVPSTEVPPPSRA